MPVQMQHTEAYMLQPIKQVMDLSKRASSREQKVFLGRVGSRYLVSQEHKILLNVLIPLPTHFKDALSDSFPVRIGQHAPDLKFGLGFRQGFGQAINL